MTRVVALELNSCAGGMALGARAAGIEFAVSVDWSDDACATYERGLGHRPLKLDIRELHRLVLAGWRPAPALDLLVADPPCTPWSRAGNREGIADERDLLLVTVDLVRALRPRCWLIANVPGLDDGPNWPTVQATIGSLGDRYAIDFRRLDAADYGVPQHRVRPFWFGRPHNSASLAWPVPTHGDPRSLGHAELGESRRPWVTCREALSHLSGDEIGHEVRVRRLPRTSRAKPGHKLSDADSPARALTKNTHSDGALIERSKHPISHANKPAHCITASDGGGAKGGRVCEWPWDRPSTTLQREERIAPPGHHGKSFMSAAELDRPATTVTARDEIGQPHRNGRDGTSRSTNAIKLSERAALILQGFPDGYWVAGKTKRARWSQIGQAMPPPLAGAAFSSIARWFAAHAAMRSA